MRSRLVLHNISEREADVYVHTPLTNKPHCALCASDEDEKRLGRVYRHTDKYGGGQTILLWSARDVHEINHGDQYLTAWDAARQLALALKVKVS